MVCGMGGYLLGETLRIKAWVESRGHNNVTFNVATEYHAQWCEWLE